MNKKIWYILLLAALIVVIWAIWRHNAKGPAAINMPGGTDNANQTQTATTTGSNQPVNNNVWQGTLKISDNPKKGNLMLVMDKTTVYINTSRDYSDLIGQKVSASYEGTLDSFRLGDIVKQ